MMSNNEENRAMSREEFENLFNPYRSDIHPEMAKRQALAEYDRLTAEVERLKSMPEIKHQLELQHSIKELREKHDRVVAECEMWKQKYHKEAERGDVKFTENMTKTVQLAEKDVAILELTRALRNLHDEQNDAPLERHRKTWEEAMERAGEILKKYEI